MKLAEALRERKQLQIKMGTLRQKLIDNAIYQEGSKPVEDPAELIKALESTRGELAALIKRINATNSSVKVGDFLLGDLVVDRDTRIMEVTALNNLIDQASQVSNRYSRSEILVLPSINVKETQKKVDQLAKDIRELDNLIQATNWNTELIYKLIGRAVKGESKKLTCSWPEGPGQN